jgi:hypothetical protein
MILALDPRPAVRTRPRLVDRWIKDMPMLLYEALARSRQREALEAARRYRLARGLVAGRRWAWLAAFASRRAALARRAVGAAPVEGAVLRASGTGVR